MYFEYDYSTRVSIIRNIKTLEMAKEIADRIIARESKNSEILKIFGDIICRKGNEVVEQF
jgi:hypothetical protein